MYLLAVTCYKSYSRSLLLQWSKVDHIITYSFNSTIKCRTGSLDSNGYDNLIFYTFVSWLRLCTQTVGQYIVPVLEHLLDIFYHPIKHRLLKRTSMIKAEILPKTPRELRSNFQIMQKVLKLNYIDTLAYYKNIFWSKLMQFKKEKTDFFTTQTILSIVSPGTLSVNRQLFSSILVEVWRPQKHLTIPSNGSSVSANVEFCFCFFYFFY